MELTTYLLAALMHSNSKTLASNPGSLFQLCCKTKSGTESLGSRLLKPFSGLLTNWHLLLQGTSLTTRKFNSCSWSAVCAGHLCIRHAAMVLHSLPHPILASPRLKCWHLQIFSTFLQSKIIISN